MTEEDTKKVLETLCANLFNAKKAEEEAKKKRTDIEEQIAKLIPTAERGSKTMHAVNFKVTVKRDLNYKVSDVDSCMIECGDFCFKKTEKYELISANYEKLRKENPKEFAKIAKYVEVKPKKVSVELKL